MWPPGHARHRRHLTLLDVRLTRSVRSTVDYPTTPEAGRYLPAVGVRARAQSEVRTMFTFPPAASRTAQTPANNQELQPCPGARLPNGDNGEPTKVSRPGPRLPNGDNGEPTKVSRPALRLPNGDNGEIASAECGHGQETVPERGGIERRSRPGPPIETASNGKAQIEANERRLCLGSPLETGDNGKAQVESNERLLSLGRPIETGDNGKAQMTEYERRLRLRPPLGNGDNGEISVVPLHGGRTKNPRGNLPNPCISDVPDAQ
jgi:hypothetical protein